MLVFYLIVYKRLVVYFKRKLDKLKMIQKRVIVIVKEMENGIQSKVIFLYFKDKKYWLMFVFFVFKKYYLYLK